jgi:hypothetical protein
VELLGGRLLPLPNIRAQKLGCLSSAYSLWQL